MFPSGDEERVPSHDGDHSPTEGVSSGAAGVNAPSLVDALPFGPMPTGQRSADELGDRSHAPESEHHSDASIIEKIEEGVQRLLEAFERKLAYDSSKQRQVDRLHDELQQHRAGLVARATRPLTSGLIKLHDDIGKLNKAWQGRPPEDMTPERLVALLEGLQEDVEILLRLNGIESFREAATTFNPRLQKFVQKVPTSEEALSGKVADSLRPGFCEGDELLEKERVAIYHFEAAKPASPDTSPADGASASVAGPPKQEF